MRGLVRVTRSAASDGRRIGASLGAGSSVGSRRAGRAEDQDHQRGPDQRAHQQVQRPERGRQQVEHHGRGHRDLRDRGGQDHARRPPQRRGRRRPPGG